MVKVLGLTGRHSEGRETIYLLVFSNHLSGKKSLVKIFDFCKSSKVDLASVVKFPDKSVDRYHISFAAYLESELKITDDRRPGSVAAVAAAS